MKRTSYLLTIFIILVIQFLFINPTKSTFAGTTVSAPFVDDTNNFNSGVNITKDMAGITQPTLE